MVATGHGGAARGAPVNAAQWPQRCSLPSPGTLASPERGAKGTPSGRGQRCLGGLASAEDGEGLRGVVGVPLWMMGGSGGTAGDYCHRPGGAHHGAQLLPDQRFSTFFGFLNLKS